MSSKNAMSGKNIIGEVRTMLPLSLLLSAAEQRRREEGREHEETKERSDDGSLSLFFSLSLSLLALLFSRQCIRHRFFQPSDLWLRYQFGALDHGRAEPLEAERRRPERARRGQILAALSLR